jgi:hypothetical protein
VGGTSLCAPRVRTAPRPVPWQEARFIPCCGMSFSLGLPPLRRTPALPRGYSVLAHQTKGRTLGIYVHLRALAGPSFSHRGVTRTSHHEPALWPANTEQPYTHYYTSLCVGLGCLLSLAVGGVHPTQRTWDLPLSVWT